MDARIRTAAERITLMVDMWLEKMNLPHANKTGRETGREIFTQTVADIIEAALKGPR